MFTSTTEGCIRRQRHDRSRQAAKHPERGEDLGGSTIEIHRGAGTGTSGRSTAAASPTREVSYPPLGDTGSPTPGQRPEPPPSSSPPPAPGVTEAAHDKVGMAVDKERDTRQNVRVPSWYGAFGPGPDFEDSRRSSPGRHGSIAFASSAR